MKLERDQARGTVFLYDIHYLIHQTSWFLWKRYKNYFRHLQKISKKLSDCVNYIHAVHFHSFEESKKTAKYYHMSSFGESKAEKFANEESEDAKAFVEYNTRQISRIYPGAKRQDSSNLKPQRFWNAGCQIGKFAIFNFFEI